MARVAGWAAAHEEPVVVLAEGDLQELVLAPNLGRLLRLEGCLSGKVPKGAKPAALVWMEER